MAQRIVDIGKDNFGTKCHFIGTEADAIRANASADMLEALREIALGRGPFKIDPMAHAESVIETMKQVAKDAIAKAEGK